jgi:hypothetical protein
MYFSTKNNDAKMVASWGQSPNHVFLWELIPMDQDGSFSMAHPTGRCQARMWSFRRMYPSTGGEQIEATNNSSTGSSLMMTTTSHHHLHNRVLPQLHKCRFLIHSQLHHPCLQQLHRPNHKLLH